MRGRTRWIVAAMLGLVSCSFVTDFNPDKANSGGAGGMSGAGGMGGSGGMTDAAVDAKQFRDAMPADAPMPDARVSCTGSGQCDDGFACTTDYCDGSGTCRHISNTMDTNNYCSLPTPCTTDRCQPEDPAHYPDGCVHDFNPCPADQICVYQQGCVTVSCQGVASCPPPADCCKVATCTNHTCGETDRCTGGRQCIHLDLTSCQCQ